MSDTDHSPIDKALDVLVFAPLGIALFARDTVPGFVKLFVARGRSELDQRRRSVSGQMSQARTVGQFAVRYGGPEMRRRMEDGVATARTRAEETFAGFVVGRDTGGPTARVEMPAKATPNGNGRARAATSSSAATPFASSTATGTGPPVASLSIPDYDELSASQVVERLDGLGAAELDRIRAYESAHRCRRTILGKIAQLTP